MAEESVVVFLKAQIGEFTDKMKKAEHDATSFAAKSGSSFDRVGKLATGVLVGAGAAAVAFGGFAVKAALEGEQAHARLATAIKNAGQDEKDYQGQIETTVAKMAKYGFQNDEVENSIARLTTVTHDTQKAINLQGLAADIAKGRNIDLASATDILVKVEAGRVGLLSRLGINVKDNEGKTISQTEAIKRLSALYQGQAQASANTFAGKLAALRAEGANLTEEIGNALIPIIIKLATAGVAVISWLQRTNDATGGLLAKFGLVAAGAVLIGAAVIKLIQGFQAMVGAIGRAAGAMSDFVVLMQVWILENPELVAAIAAVTVVALTLAAAFGVLGDRHDEVNKKAKDLTAAILDEKKSMEEASAAALTKFLTDHTELVDVMNKAAVSATDVESAILGNKDAYNSVMQALDAYEQQQIRMNGVHSQGVEDVRHLKDEIGLERDAVSRSREQVAAHTQVSEQLTTAKEKQASAHRDAAAAATQEKASQDALISSLKRLNDLTIQAAGGQIALDNATLRVGDAMKDEADKAEAAAKAGGKSADANRALQESSNAVKQAILDAASAAATNAKAHVDLTSKAKGTALTLEEERAKHAAIKRELDVLEFTYPALRGQIEAYRHELGLLPARVSTDVNVNLHVNSAGVASVSIGAITLHAAGGIIGPNELGIAGEAGAELLEGLPGGGVRVLSHKQTLAAIGGGRAGGGGNTAPIFNFYGILDGADAGRAVTRILSDYRNDNGRLPWENN